MNIDDLKNKLGDCTQSKSSLCTDKTSYVEVNFPLFYVIDDMPGHPIRYSENKNDRQLTVRNENSKSICLVKVDKCLLNSDEYQKCDCILFDDERVYFVELSQASKKNRRDKRLEAIKQLGNTLEILKNSAIDFTALIPKAVICFRTISTYPIQAASLSKWVIFRNKHQVDLTEGDEIIF